MYKIVIKRSADKQLDKISKGDLRAALKIRTFLKELEKVENPFATNYRIIGLKQDEILTIEIIEISSREKAY